MRYKTPLSLVILLLLLISCEKQTLIPSQVALLSQAKWKMVSWESYPGYPTTLQDGTKTEFENMFERQRALKDTCVLDAQFSFSPGPGNEDYQEGPFTYYEGKTSCNITTPVYSGVWMFQDLSGTTGVFLYLDEHPYELDGINKIYAIYHVDELSDTQLVLRLQDANYRWVKTFKRIP